MKKTFRDDNSFDIDHIPDLYNHDAIQITIIPIHNLVPRTNQPRKSFDDETIQELSSSIKSTGLLNPLIVRIVNNHFEIIAGERRYHALKLAGEQNIPCIVKEIADDTQTFIMSLIENLHREDLNPLDEAAAYGHLNELGMTQEEIGKIVGKKQSTISNIMSINKLPECVYKKYSTSNIPKSQLLEIAKAPTVEAIENFAEKTMKESLTVKDIREANKAAKSKEALPGRSKKSDVFTTFMKMAKSYTKVLNKHAENDISALSEGERTALRNKIIENRKIEDSWLEKLTS